MSNKETQIELKEDQTFRFVLQNITAWVMVRVS